MYHEYYKHKFNWKLIQLYLEDTAYRCLDCGGCIRTDYGITYCPRCDNHGHPYTQVDRDLVMARFKFELSRVDK